MSGFFQSILYIALPFSLLPHTDLHSLPPYLIVISPPVSKHRISSTTSRGGELRDNTVLWEKGNVEAKLFAAFSRWLIIEFSGFALPNVTRSGIWRKQNWGEGGLKISLKEIGDGFLWSDLQAFWTERPRKREFIFFFIQRKLRFLENFLRFWGLYEKRRISCTWDKILIAPGIMILQPNSINLRWGLLSFFFL